MVFFILANLLVILFLKVNLASSKLIKLVNLKSISMVLPKLLTSNLILKATSTFYSTLTNLSGRAILPVL